MKKIYTAMSNTTVAGFEMIGTNFKTVDNASQALNYGSMLLAQEARMGFLIRQVTLKADFKTACTAASLTAEQVTEIEALDPTFKFDAK